MYFDFQFAKAEAYYYRHQETVLGEAWKYKMVPGWEIKIERPHSENTGDAKKWDCLVPERELGQIERYIYTEPNGPEASEKASISPSLKGCAA